MARKKQYIPPRVTIYKLLVYAAEHDSSRQNTEKYFVNDRSREELGNRFINLLETVYPKFRIGRLEFLQPDHILWYMTKKKSGVTAATKKKYVEMVNVFNKIAMDYGLIPNDAKQWTCLCDHCEILDSEFSDLDEDEKRNVLNYFYIRDPKFYLMLCIQNSLSITNEQICSMKTENVSSDGKTVMSHDVKYMITDSNIVKYLQVSRNRAIKMKMNNLFANNYQTSVKRLISSYNAAIRAAQESNSCLTPPSTFIPNDEPVDPMIAIKRMNAYAYNSFQNAVDKKSAKKTFFATTQTASDYGKVFLRILISIYEHFSISHISELAAEHFAWYQFEAFVNFENSETVMKKNQAIIRKYEKIALQMKWKNPDLPDWMPESPIGSQKRTEICYPLEDDEAEDLLSYLLEYNDLWYKMAAMQICFGLRLKEVCYLRISSIDIQNCQLKLTADDKTKGGRPRIVQSHHPLASSLLADLEKMSRYKTMVFAGSKSKADANYIEYPKAIKAAYRELDIDHTKTHDLRRTFSRQQLDYYLDNNYSIDGALSAVSQDLGHGDARMRKGLINKYVRSDEFDKEDQSEMKWLRNYCSERQNQKKAI